MSAQRLYLSTIGVLALAAGAAGLVIWQQNSMDELAANSPLAAQDAKAQKGEKAKPDRMAVNIKLRNPNYTDLMNNSGDITDVVSNDSMQAELANAAGVDSLEKYQTSNIEERLGIARKPRSSAQQNVQGEGANAAGQSAE